MEILYGILYCMAVTSVYKYIHFKYFRDNEDEPSFSYWFKNNIGDYLMLVVVSFITVKYSHEVVDSINIVFQKFKLDWKIPHFEDVTFYWIVTPIIFPLVLGKFSKKKIRKPLASKIKNQNQ